jgi:hypothetical protein
MALKTIVCIASSIAAAFSFTVNSVGSNKASSMADKISNAVISFGAAANW